MAINNRIRAFVHWFEIAITGHHGEIPEVTALVILLLILVPVGLGLQVLGFATGQTLFPIVAIILSVLFEALVLWRLVVAVKDLRSIMRGKKEAVSRDDK